MTKARNLLPPLSVLEKELELLPDGTLLWKCKRSGVSAGSQAGHVSSSDGYRYVCISRVRYAAHRVVWKMAKRTEPPFTLDHIDGDRTNNRPDNLRECSQLENLRNKTRAKKNKNNLSGVHRSNTKKPRWYAQIKLEDKSLYLGSFDSEESAYKARVEAEQRYFGAFAPLRKENV